MPDRSKKDPEVYFQLVNLEFHNPITGENKIWSFIGPAMFRPEHAEKLKEAPLADTLKDLEIEEPYNPFEDETNTEAQKWLINLLRDRLSQEEDG